MCSVTRVRHARAVPAGAIKRTTLLGKEEANRPGQRACLNMDKAHGDRTEEETCRSLTSSISPDTPLLLNTTHLEHKQILLEVIIIS